MKLIRSRNKTLLLLFTFFSTFSFSQNSKLILVLDAGHGGHDSGAIGWNNIREKDIALQICLEVVRLNKELYKDKVDIFLTRSHDKFISLTNRSKLAIALNADLFIAVHCNKMNGNNIAKGMEVFVAPPKPHYSQENIKKSIALATDLHMVFTKKLKIKKRGVKFQNFQVLRETIDYCPSVLLETAFISNQHESEYFQDKNNISAIALAIIESVYNYLNKAI